jgi:hypothetical protein
MGKIDLDVAKAEDDAASPATGFALRFNKVSKGEIRLRRIAYRPAWKSRPGGKYAVFFHRRNLDIGFPILLRRS